MQFRFLPRYLREPAEKMTHSTAQIEYKKCNMSEGIKSVQNIYMLN